ncbi:CLUMA_CG005516, isoform A [Clunio marinus]|uniref:CLUMA_CG005516, isoform A n=1 Tax=Clunio marinus TaxID=568069 RepID=A0A1J1HUZ1_9DIPT|nr:CLUMA_CG005516, isoform A [Clunio marinus]
MIVHNIALLLTLAFVSTASAALQCVSGCWHNNVFYPVGSTVTCPVISQNCIGRDIPGQCCPEEFCGCTRNGIDYKIGDEVPSFDTCNTCWCDSNLPQPNNIDCTEEFCGCIRNGIEYQDGDEVPSLDTCNTCWCDGTSSPPNNIYCTEIACTSEPTEGPETPEPA